MLISFWERVRRFFYGPPPPPGHHVEERGTCRVCERYDRDIREDPLRDVQYMQWKWNHKLYGGCGITLVWVPDAYGPNPKDL